MDNEDKRKLFEKLWIDSGGHLRFFTFNPAIEKYGYSGVTDDLSKDDLMMARITLNTAYLFYLGGWKQSESLKP